MSTAAAPPAPAAPAAPPVPLAPVVVAPHAGSVVSKATKRTRSRTSPGITVLIYLPNDLPFSGRRQTVAQTYHGRE